MGGKQTEQSLGEENDRESFSHLNPCGSLHFPWHVSLRSQTNRKVDDLSITTPSQVDGLLLRGWTIFDISGAHNMSLDH